MKIEDYALIGNMQTAALVGRNGSIDWMCVPHFDSPSCFAALLGNEDNGRWIIAPKSSSPLAGTRKYWDNTLTLETIFETKSGKVRLVDTMLLEDGDNTVIRMVEGLVGHVEMTTEIVIRFDYGSTVPWVRKEDGGILAIAGGDNVLLESDIELRGENFKTHGDFKISQGEKKFFVLRYFKGIKAPPKKIKDPWELILKTSTSLKEWSQKSTYDGRWKPQVMRSLLTLKALTCKESGGIVAAPTTSLPELIGGERNWDYRYCWLRDATFILYSLMVAGYKEEASDWREWLLRAIAGKPSQIKILYGVEGERFNAEYEIPWLNGYENSKPVRVGNAAQSQFQIDVYGELADTLYLAIKTLEPSPNRKQGWSMLCALLENLEGEWAKPDRGIWEIRGEPQHFVHSKVMAWVAFDRAIRISEDTGLGAPLERWKNLRTGIYEEVMEKGYDSKLASFTQSYGNGQLDASLLMLPLVGFINAKDPRMVSTVKAIEKYLLEYGLIKRYVTDGKNIDGLVGGEGAFLPCTFWYVDNLYLQGRTEEALGLFEDLLELCNDVGLLSEEYDPKNRRMLGNFPQAFSHVSLINTARNLSPGPGPAEIRGDKGGIVEAHKL